MQGGSSITQEDLDTLIVYNGQTLREFLKEREKTVTLPHRSDQSKA